MMTDIDTLSETLQRSRRRVALTADGEPIITADQADPTLSYVHPKTFVDKLKETGRTIHPYSLVIEQIKEEPKKPKKSTVAPPEGTPPEDPKVPETPKEEHPINEDGTPGKNVKMTKKDFYTKKELTEIGSTADGYKCLQKIAGADPDVPGNKSKTKLIELLTGRPKFEL